MIKLEAKTKLSKDKTVERVKQFFGKGGLGLEIKEETGDCLCFEGGGGYVTTTVCSEEKKTRIELETREWEFQVKKFISELP